MNLHRLLALTSALGAFGALAQPGPARERPAPKVYIAPFKGLRTAATVQKQLSDVLCARASCIELPRQAPRGQPKPPSPDFVLTGQLTASKGGGRVALSVVPASQPGKPPGPAVYSQLLALTADQSSMENVDQVSEALELAMGLPRSAAPPVELETTEDTAPSPAPVPARAANPTAVVGPPEPSQPLPVPGAHAPWVVAQVGVSVITRNWGYAGLQGKTLRGYRAGVVPMPAVHLEIYPLARMGNAALAGLALEGGYATSVGLASSTRDGLDFPTVITRWDAGWRYRAPGLMDGKLSFTAFGGYRVEGFEVSAARDGTTLTGLPSPTYSSIRVGGGASFRLGPVRPFLEAAALPVLSTGELQKAYFPRTSGLGMEGQAGAEVTFTPMLGLRVAGHVTRYALTFKTLDTDPYIASGAVDLYAGVTAALRASF